jgi:hypothetical protein
MKVPKVTPTLSRQVWASPLRPHSWLGRNIRGLSNAEKRQRCGPFTSGSDWYHALVNYMDLIKLTYDQTLRGILRGLGPDDLRYFIYKPAHVL